MSFARPSDPKLETIAADTLLREVQGLMSPNLESRKVQLVVESSPELFIRADSGHLKQVLINLVRNAAEAIDGAGTVTLRARAARAPLGGRETDAVILEVADTARASRPKSRSACSTRSSARRKPAPASACRLPLASLKSTAACSSIKPGPATARPSALSCRANTRHCRACEWRCEHANLETGKPTFELAHLPAQRVLIAFLLTFVVAGCRRFSS